MAKQKRSYKKNERVFINRNIKAREVRCIDHANENIGVISLYKAIDMAEKAGLDLIQISKQGEQVPICKIVDYGKYKYELSKRTKEQAKKQRESQVKTKEIKFRPTSGINDLRTKAKKASKFMSDGCRVKVAIQFRGREMAHQDVAEDRFLEFLSLLECSIDLLNEPKMTGRTMVALLAPSKKQKVVEIAS